MTNYIIKIQDIFQAESEALSSDPMPLEEVMSILPKLLKPSLFGRNYFRITIQPTIQEIWEEGGCCPPEFDEMATNGFRG